MHTTAIDILDKMIEELESEKPEEDYAIRCLRRAKHDILVSTQLHQ